MESVTRCVVGVNVTVVKHHQFRLKQINPSVSLINRLLSINKMQPAPNLNPSSLPPVPKCPES